MDSVKLAMTYDRCDAVYEFIQDCLASEKPKTIHEKLVNVLMWRVRNKFRSKIESNRDGKKCNISLDAELALAFLEYFTKYCPFECQTYPGVTIQAHLQTIDKKYG